MGQRIASLYAEISADTTKLQSGMKDAKQQVGGFKDTMLDLYAKVNLAKEAFGVFTGTFTKAMDIAKEGAALDYAAGKFDKLSASIGTTSDALLGDLRRATKGTRTDAELMASAGDLMSLGLAKTYDQVVRLTTVAGALNMDMNQLVLTLANKTTMRFDQLGVSVDGFAGKVKELEKAGMSADDAFGEAFLRQAEAQVALLGDAADSSVGDIKRMEVAMANAGNAAKQKLAPFLTQAAVAVTGLLTNARNLNSALVNHASTLNNTNMTYEQYRAELERASELVGARISQEGQYEAYLLRTGEKIRVMSEAEWEAQRAAEESDRALMGMATTLEGSVIPAAESGATAIDGVATAAYGAEDIMRSYTDALLFNIASQDLDAASALALARSMGLVDGSTELAYQKTAAFKAMLEAGEITIEEYNAKILALQGFINGLEDKEITVTMNVESNYAFGASDSELPGRSIPRPREEEQAVGGVGRDVAWVGEQGPELKVGGRGSYVLSNRDAMNAVKGDTTVNLYFNGYGQPPDPNAYGRSVARAIQRGG